MGRRSGSSEGRKPEAGGERRLYTGPARTYVGPARSGAGGEGRGRLAPLGSGGPARTGAGLLR